MNTSNIFITQQLSFTLLVSWKHYIKVLVIYLAQEN